MIDQLRRNLRLAVRSLRKRPLFLLVSVASLAVGIGATTTIFSAVDHFLLRSPPGIPNADRMVEVGRGRDGSGFDSFSYPDFLDLRREADPLEELAGYSMQMLTLSRGERGDRAFGLLVSANYFRVLGVQAHLGRTFLPEEDAGVDEHPVAVVSHGYWQNRLGGNRDVVGSTLYVSRRPYTVVGVAPPGFRGHIAVANPDVYLPLVQRPSLNQGRDYFEQRSASFFQVLGLLAPGATLEEADAAVSTVFRRLAEEHPETNANRTASVRPFGALPAAIQGPAGLFFGVLMAFVSLLLVITCANVAGMFLARASSRTREIAIRLSMGSGRLDLVLHLLTEALLVFFLGGVAGFLLAAWSLDALSALSLPAPFPVHLEMGADGRILAFALAVTLLTGSLFGLLPARAALDLDLLGALKDEGERSRSSKGRLRRGFVAAQVAGSLVLLVAAGLLLRALQTAGEMDKGFRAEGAYLTQMDLSAEGYGNEEGSLFQEEILSHFSRRAPVRSVALSTDLPLDLSARGTGVVPEGWESTQERPNVSVGFNDVSPKYFQTLRIPILEGRGFLDSDREGSEPVAVVSRTFVRRVWPGESALGRRIRWGGSEDTWLTVVGVAEDVHNQILAQEMEPFVYRPLAQHYGPEVSLVIRAAPGVDHGPVSQEIRAGLTALDPTMSLSPVLALDRYTEVSILPQRLAGFLSAGLGLLALLLSGIGVYGVMAFAVSRRTREMGIRMALGAEPGRVLRSVVAGAFRLALPGLLVGAVLAVGVGYALRGLLLGVSPADPGALVAVSLALAGMVLLGAIVPARRAARVDPGEALRNE
mgnify:CR=1 FL=1